MKQRPFFCWLGAPPPSRYLLGLAGYLWLGASCLPARAEANDRSIQPPPDPYNQVIHPVKIVSTTGSVANGDALVSGEGNATLTMTAGGTAPQVIVDYGRVVGGLPVFRIAAASGAPNLRAIYSESQQYLLPSGDGAPGVTNVPGDPSRADDYAVNGPGLIVNHLIQGSERFEAITLTTPGTVTLNAGILSRTFEPKNAANTGHFDCSDPTLTEVWNLGARTLQVDSLPVASQPLVWTVSPQGADVKGSAPFLYQAGGRWTDYTATFDVQVVANEAAWIVRGQMPAGGDEVTLAADNDALGTPNTLRIGASGPGGGAPTSVELPFDLKPGTWHQVATTVTGTSLTVSIDGQPVASATVSATDVGSVGFFNQDGAEALFRDLSVTDAAGRTLYRSSLTDPQVLAQFAAGTNVLPVLVDGAKRDRMVWIGDMSLEAPTIYYSSGASEFAAGSLILFGSVRDADGEISSVLSPLVVPGIAAGPDFPRLPFLGGPFYALSYSINFVTNLYDYYLYTGDKGLVEREWSAVESEFAYLAANANGQHLVVTDDLSGHNWQVQDLTGVVTAYNVLYNQALRNAAVLAAAIGRQDEAAGFTSLASLVESAINSTLFDAAANRYDLSDSDRTTVVQDANSLAVLYGVAPTSKAAAILEAMDSALNTANGPLAQSGSSLISPFMSGYDVLAHFEAGEAQAALGLIRAVWSHMLPGTPFYSGCTFEALQPDGTPPNAGASLSHGWGSGPTSALSKYVLGVRPLTPGYQTWLVEPQPGDLSWAAGTVPTPYGQPIAVAWQKGAQGFSLELWVPAGTRGTVGLPVTGTNVTLSDNERTVAGVNASQEPNGRAGYLYLQNLQPGPHRIQVTGP